MAFGLNRARGIDPYATAPTAEAVPVWGAGQRPWALARAALSFGFVVYLAVVGLSALQLSPFATRGVAAGLLGLGLTASALSLWLSFALRSPRADVGSERLGALAQSEPPSARALVGLGYGALVAGLLATLAAWLLAWRLPIGAYDALGYRLPAIAQWLDAGRLAWVSGDDPLRNGYPLGLEAVEAVVFRAFGSASAVDCVASGLVVAGAAALAGFARTLGVARPLAALSAGLFLLVPMHLLNAPSGYADAAFAGVLVSFWATVARWVTSGPLAGPGSGTSRWLVGYDLGIAAALVIALKPHGVGFVALSLALGLFVRAREIGLRASATELGPATLLATPGLFFAIRNVVMTGNPLYPLEVRLAGRVWLRGESSLDGILTPDFNVPPQLTALPALLRPLWVWLQPYGPATEFDDRLAGFGYAFLLIGLPALGWALLRTFKPTGERVRTTWLGLAMMCALTLVCWVLQPFAFWPRFSSWLWGAAALSLALWLSALVEQARGRSAVALALSTLLLALPEALYALSHVKRIDRFGLALLRDDPVTALSHVAGVDADFVRRVLVGKVDVCRTPWRLGTDDANLDGVVAQLLPRPRMHVLKEKNFRALIAAARERGCDQLIVIGDNPVLASAPSSWAKRIETVTAFGSCRLIPVLSAEVTP